MLFSHTKKILLIVCTLLLVSLPMTYVIYERVYREVQQHWLKDNMQKVRLGMTYKQVESLLGDPHAILFNSRDDLKNTKMNLKNNIIEVFTFDSGTKPGEIGFLYFYDDSNPNWPIFSFDSTTGKLTRISRRPYQL
jgi:hypothetical protein